VHLTPLRKIKVSVLSLAIMWAPADTGTLHAVTPDDSVDKEIQTLSQALRIAGMPE
jgi:hypothetical protein